jgi:hypothetical protein
MQRLTLEDILEVDAYARVRDAYRARVIEHKKQRRIAVGPHVSLVFEDRETLRYQIQEMTRVEQTTDPEKVQIEVDVYNELVPGAGELSATLFIEIPELARIQPELDRLVGIDEHVALVIPELEDARVVARFDARQMEEDRISAVHYLRFAFSDAQLAAWRSGRPVSLRIDHPSYTHEAVLGESTRASLTRDLQDDPPVLLDAEEMRQAREAASDVIQETGSVRVRRVWAAGGADRIVVEAVAPGTSFLSAEPALLAELVATAQRQARELQARSGAARVRLDLLSGEPGPLRFEIRAIR